MILQETSLQAQIYLWCAGFLLFSAILFYFLLNDNSSAGESDIWSEEFSNLGVKNINIDDISHDDDIWYYQKIPTCVAYEGSEYNKACNKNIAYCGGGDTIGTPKQQVVAVLEAIQNGGQHNMCPLIIS